MDKIRKRLASRKKSFFSEAGTLSLIKSVLIAEWYSHLLLFLFCTSFLVHKSIKKLMRDFLLEVVEEGKGSHLVSWEC